jgi:hypothetical protein
MCDLQDPLRGSRTGYKLIAVEIATGKFFSLAMGFEYRPDKFMPRIMQTARQHRMTEYYSDKILSYDTGLFKPEMVGRTTVYQNLGDVL